MLSSNHRTAHSSGWTPARAKQENRAALIAGITAGFPTVNEGIAAIQATLNSGADIVEVGLPYSDPVLDGPVIQAADDIALRGGVRIADVIRTVREAYQATGKPVLVMSYWNPIDRYGADASAANWPRRAAPDASCLTCPCRSPRGGEKARSGTTSPPSSWPRRARPTNDYGNSPRRERVRLRLSLLGVTGVREAVSTAASALVRRIRATTDLPVCVGIGISDAAQAAQVAGFADGVIVSSALVKAILDAPDPAAGVAAVAELTADLSLATRRPVD